MGLKNGDLMFGCENWTKTGRERGSLILGFAFGTAKRGLEHWAWNMGLEN